MVKRKEKKYLRQKPNPKANYRLCIIAAIRSKEELLDPTVDNDEIIWKDNPFDTPILDDPDDDGTKMLNKIHLSGSTPLQEKIRKACADYKDIFSETVRPDPANVPPMELEVDLVKWQTNKSRGPPRPQPRERQRVIEEQVRTLSASFFTPTRNLSILILRFVFLR